jgi:hypothetical protein
VYLAFSNVSSSSYKWRSMRSPRTKRWFRGKRLTWWQDHSTRSYVLVMTVISWARSVAGVISYFPFLRAPRRRRGS